MKTKTVREMRTKNSENKKEVMGKIRKAVKLISKDDLIKMTDGGMNTEVRTCEEESVMEGINSSTGGNGGNSTNRRKGTKRSIQRDREEEENITSKSEKRENRSEGRKEKTLPSNNNNETMTKEVRPIDKIWRVKGKWINAIDMTSDDENSMIKTSKRFGPNFRGEAIIGVKLRDKYCCKNKEANSFKIMSILKKEKFLVYRITPRGFNTAEVMFHNTHEANRCIDRYNIMSEQDKRLDISLINKNMRSKGIIKDWDRSSSLQELIEAIDDTRGIVSIERMQMKKYNREERRAEWYLGNNIIITVEGKAVPKELRLWGNATGIRIRPYIEKVVQCYNCYRYGHVANICRSERRCAVCSEKYHGQCLQEAACNNCGYDHRADDKGCPSFQYNKQLKTIMAEYGINIYDAKKKWDEENRRDNSGNAWNNDKEKIYTKERPSHGDIHNTHRERREAVNKVMDRRLEERIRGQNGNASGPMTNVSDNRKQLENISNDKSNDINSLMEIMNIFISKLNNLEKGPEKNIIVKGMLEAITKMNDCDNRDKECEIEEEEEQEVRQGQEYQQIEENQQMEAAIYETHVEIHNESSQQEEDKQIETSQETDMNYSNVQYEGIHQCMDYIEREDEIVIEGTLSEVNAGHASHATEERNTMIINRLRQRLSQQHDYGYKNSNIEQ